MSWSSYNISDKWCMNALPFNYTHLFASILFHFVYTVACFNGTPYNRNTYTDFTTTSIIAHICNILHLMNKQTISCFHSYAHFNQIKQKEKHVNNESENYFYSTFTLATRCSNRLFYPLVKVNADAQLEKCHICTIYKILINLGH